MEYKDEMNVSQNTPYSSENYTPATRSEYVGNMETRLRDLGAKIDDLMAKAEVAKEKAGLRAEDLKEKAGLKVEDLKIKQEAALKRVNEIRSCSEEAWCELKPGLDRAFEDLRMAWEELKTASGRAAQKFSQ